MPRKKRASSPLELYDDDFDEDASSHSSQPPVQRNAANARERMRMRVLSSAYGRLKTKLPNIPPDTKLSKLDTLRLATLYIKQLITAVETGSGVNSATDMLDTSHLVECAGRARASTGNAVGAFNFHNNGHGGMSWPFEFHQHLQHGNRTFAFNNASRPDWQGSQQSFTKMPRNEMHLTAEVSYAHLQDNHSHVHWYPADLKHSPHMEQESGINSGCAYETFNYAPHQHSIATSQAHGL